MTVEHPPNVPPDQAMTAYGTGQAAFERGLYRESIDCFQKALALVSQSSPLGGAIQIWLVTAYDAAGQRDEALALCRQLQTHGDRETRQQSRRLLYILEAPKLQSRSEWLTQIPDLNAASETNRSWVAGQPSGKGSSKPKGPQSSAIAPFEPINPQESRGFLGLALVASAAMLVLLWWFAS